MCGIAGFFGEIARKPESKELLERMTRNLAHRGPDGEGYWLGRNIGLGHARLAIIDLDHGTQPMWDARDASVVIFNGEIYNYGELRDQLAGLGYAFRTRSDTEVILAAIDAWGVDTGLQRLRGMFAFALYDTRTEQLLLARDRVGIKPLYWAEVPEGVLFASEQKALLSSGLLSKGVNPIAIHDYLGQGYPTTPGTCWADIKLLEPATWLQIGRQGIRSGKFWRWSPRVNESLTLQQAVEKTEEVLTDSLRCHLIADVPVGSFLSGGLDSSLMVALLSRDLAPGLKTFNMGFGDPDYDESGYARQVADEFGTEHHEARMETQEADQDLFCRVLRQYDEPFGDSSCLPTYLICREMRKHVKVALSGDGGDEVLGGYVRYPLARRLASLSRFHVLLTLLNPLMSLTHRFGRRGYQIAKAWRFAQRPREEMLCGLHAYFSEAQRLALYRPEFARLALSDGPTSIRFARFIPKDQADPVDQLIAAEMGLRLHADYLRKVDVASSAHGLEVRVPYLDTEMLELAASLPLHYKIGDDGETKIISRRIVSRIMRPGIAARPKQGFGVPLDRWLGPRMRSFLKETILDREARIRSCFEPEAIVAIWRAFEDDRFAGGLSRFQRYQRVFLLSSLELWLRHWNLSAV